MEKFLYTLLGFVLAAVLTWLDRKRRIKTHWAVIKVELELCREKAAALLAADDDVKKSPLYRLPTMTYEKSLPVLFVDGALSGDDYFTLGRFFSLVQEINRGLDNAAAALYSHDTVGLNREFSRNKLKAGHLLNPEGGEHSLHEKARMIVDAKLAKRWWTF